MKRGTWRIIAASCAYLSIVIPFANPLDAAELRGRGVSRSPYRLAALQDESVLKSRNDNGGEFPSESEEAMPEDASPSDAPIVENDRNAFSPRFANPGTTNPSTKGSSGATSNAPSQRGAAPSLTRPGMPIGEPMWDADVISTPGGACSNGSCVECPRDNSSFGCYGAWGSFEYLLWWRDKRSTPPLVTTTTTIVNQGIDGELGQANTRILLGDSQFDDHLQPGGRFDLGLWVDRSQSVGVGIRFTALADDDLNYRTNSSVNSVLAVPFFNLDPTVNGEDTLLVANPLDGTTGTINVSGHNETYLGDVYLRFTGARCDTYRVDVLGGYFVSRINEDLILQTSTNTGGTTINVRDRFRTKNEYEGISLGLSGDFDRGPWKVNLLAKVALTNVRQTSIIDGLTTIGGGTQAVTGLFAQTSNSGTQVRDEFAVVPELGLNWIYHMGCGVDFTVGYTLVYWSDTIRAGEQINRRVDPTQTIAQPARQFASSDYFAQGVNFGLNWQY